MTTPQLEQKYASSHHQNHLLLSSTLQQLSPPASPPPPPPPAPSKTATTTTTTTRTSVTMLKCLFSRRRINIYLKFIALLMLAIFYFVFLFRESLNAFETNKERTDIANKLEIKPLKRRQYQTNLIQIIKSHEVVMATHRPKTSSTLNPVYEYSEEIHSAIERELHARNVRLNEICQKSNLHMFYPPKPWEFFVSPGHNLVWCNVFKAASSTWMYYFNILGGYDIKYLQRTKTPPLELARKRFPRPTLYELYESLASSLSFLCVREPFERLLSAYRDKLEGCHNKYYKILGKQIMRKFRNNESNVDVIQNNGWNNKRRHKKCGPTFKEFLRFLIHSHKISKPFDEHWAPIYSFCTPCSINFTLITKVESFQRDSEFIIRQAGLEPLLLGKLPKSKVRKISNRSPGDDTTRNLIERYFSEIDRDTLEQLLNIYRLDFELFNYNFTKYYNIIQPITAATTINTKTLIVDSNSSLSNVTTNRTATST